MDFQTEMNGYNRMQVDKVIEVLSEQYKAVHLQYTEFERKNQVLEEQIAEKDARIAAHEAEANSLRKEISDLKIMLSTAKAAAATASTPAPAQRQDPMSDAEAVGKVLLIAQLNADKLTSDAELKAAKAMTDAEAKAERLVSDAEARSAEIIDTAKIEYGTILKKKQNIHAELEKLQRSLEDALKNSQ